MVWDILLLHVSFEITTKIHNIDPFKKQYKLKTAKKWEQIL